MTANKQGTLTPPIIKELPEIDDSSDNDKIRDETMIVRIPAIDIPPPTTYQSDFDFSTQYLYNNYNTTTYGSFDLQNNLISNDNSNGNTKTHLNLHRSDSNTDGMFNDDATIPPNIDIAESIISNTMPDFNINVNIPI